MNKKNVLVIDDEKDIRDLLLISLERLGYEAQVAEDIASAKSLIASDIPFDFCLTDIRLPAPAQQ